MCSRIDIVIWPRSPRPVRNAILALGLLAMATAIGLLLTSASALAETRPGTTLEVALGTDSNHVKVDLPADQKPFTKADMNVLLEGIRNHSGGLAIHFTGPTGFDPQVEWRDISALREERLSKKLTVVLESAAQDGDAAAFLLAAATSRVAHHDVSLGASDRISSARIEDNNGKLAKTWCNDLCAAWIKSIKFPLRSLDEANFAKTLAPFQMSPPTPSASPSPTSTPTPLPTFSDKTTSGTGSSWRSTEMIIFFSLALPLALAAALLLISKRSRAAVSELYISMQTHWRQRSNRKSASDEYDASATTGAETLPSSPTSTAVVAFLPNEVRPADLATPDSRSGYRIHSALIPEGEPRPEGYLEIEGVLRRAVWIGDPTAAPKIGQFVLATPPSNGSQLFLITDVLANGVEPGADEV